MKLILPTHLVKTRRNKKDKKIALSINRYRNCHYTENNRAKKQYKQIVSDLLTEEVEELTTPLWLNFTFFTWDKRRVDLDNWCVIQSKFLWDALVELGYIDDDTVKEIILITYNYWGYDKWNQRIEVDIVDVPDTMTAILPLIKPNEQREDSPLSVILPGELPHTDVDA